MLALISARRWELEASNKQRLKDKPKMIAERTHIVSYDGAIDVLTFDGFKFSGELMRQFTETPCGEMFRVTTRENGLITISRERHPLAFAAPDLLACLQEYVRDFGDNEDSDSQIMAEKARAAIAKATASHTKD